MRNAKAKGFTHAQLSPLEQENFKDLIRELDRL